MLDPLFYSSMKSVSLLLVLAFILTKTKGAILSSPTLVSEDIVDVSRKAVSIFAEILFEGIAYKTNGLSFDFITAHS